MNFLIYFLLFTLTYTQQCLVNISMKYEQIYLCREKFNSTSIRIWLYVKFNQTNQHQLYFFSYYIFTLRVIDLIDEHKIHLNDRFEKSISNYVEINSHRKENHTIHIHHLSPGRYEICVNFFNKKSKNFYYRSSNSCLHIPWNVPEHEREPPNLFLHVFFMILIIILLVTIAFFIYALHQYFKSRKPSLQPVATEDIDEDNDPTERVKFLVNQHFVQDTNPFGLSVRKRIHQRYAHRSPDLNDR